MWVTYFLLGCTEALPVMPSGCEKTRYGIDFKSETYQEVDDQDTNGARSRMKFLLRDPHSLIRNHTPDGYLYADMPRSELLKAGPLELLRVESELEGTVVVLGHGRILLCTFKPRS